MAVEVEGEIEAGEVPEERDAGREAPPGSPAQWEGEAERLRAQVAELQAQVEAARAALLRSAVSAAAGRAGFRDPADALALADLSAVTVEDGRVQGADEAIQALARARPYLVKAAGDGHGTPRRAEAARAAAPAAPPEPLVRF